ncbi:hypothetical protein [Alkalihalobacterium elongatum]|uniref:hypothetical protein n=1 Tax=Alkalihalobacterium elongatum TaxID=2675466 RepID=UPI001C1FEFEF|nr:hypothetical protein [Alkalihalobacterium elongatum]
MNRKTLIFILGIATGLLLRATLVPTVFSGSIVKIIDVAMVIILICIIGRSVYKKFVRPPQNENY